MGARTKHKMNLPKQEREDNGTTLPFEFPAYLNIYRLMEDMPEHAPPLVNSRGLKGWTAELDCFTFKAKVYVRIGRDGTLAVFAETKEGTTKIWEMKNAVRGRKSQHRGTQQRRVDDGKSRRPPGKNARRS